MKQWRIMWIAVAVAVAVLALAGVAVAANKAPGPATTPGTAAGANCGVTNPQALAELQVLRTDFFTARHAWFDKWGTNRTSAAAQAELQKLRDDHRAKVQAVFDKYGIDATAGTGAANGMAMALRKVWSGSRS